MPASETRPKTITHHHNVQMPSSEAEQRSDARLCIMYDLRPSHATGNAEPAVRFVTSAYCIVPGATDEKLS
jgi:hypothetical protein